MAMSELTPPTRRRSLQFSLGMTLLLVALAAALSFAVSEHMARRRLDAANAALEAELAQARAQTTHPYMQLIEAQERAQRSQHLRLIPGQPSR
jgi:hypothetical protein